MPTTPVLVLLLLLADTSDIADDGIEPDQLIVYHITTKRSGHPARLITTASSRSDDIVTVSTGMKAKRTDRAQLSRSGHGHNWPTRGTNHIKTPSQTVFVCRTTVNTTTIALDDFTQLTQICIVQLIRSTEAVQLPASLHAISDGCMYSASRVKARFQSTSGPSGINKANRLHRMPIFVYRLITNTSDIDYQRFSNRYHPYFSKKLSDEQPIESWLI